MRHPAVAEKALTQTFAPSPIITTSLSTGATPGLRERAEGAVLYTRVSTVDQQISGSGLAAQLDATRAAAASRGWRTIAELSDTASGGTLARPELQRALEMIERYEATALVVARIDRATRSVGDFATLLERIEGAGAVFVACDIGVDTSTSGGRFVANVIASVAAWERDVIRERTKAAMRALPRERRNGRPCFSDEVLIRARALRASGLTLAQVGKHLEAEGVHPPRGGQAIHASSVRRMLDAADPGLH